MTFVLKINLLFMRTACFILLLFLSGCKLLPGDIAASGSKEVKLSQFEKAGYCDLLIAKDGTYHAVFLEKPDYGKPVFVYYSYSTNKGKSWSAPVTISNDGTGNGSSIPRLIQDGSGTIYAIWKRFGSSDKSQYPVPETTLEGTGGYNIGTLFYAVLNGNTFGKPIMLASDELMQVSWFPTVDNEGALITVDMKKKTPKPPKGPESALNWNIVLPSIIAAVTSIATTLTLIFVLKK